MIGECITVLHGKFILSIHSIIIKGKAAIKNGAYKVSSPAYSFAEIILE